MSGIWIGNGDCYSGMKWEAKPTAARKADMNSQTDRQTHRRTEKDNSRLLDADVESLSTGGEHVT